eukprot:gnl/MRDRNA2_/MRDRNA2_91451_c0_seq1.p1 gnl/MRDRNA2_/MRDRNA2_91451_c0~~gnl/MRDRNA2_/MRDRNA2_91451_c0_seq1.p1  ORF type:complete len:185 (+),score=41.22 gnl/MRDRNA2_/MRDRNA2_91451_c0_seq1:76-630(+)
MAIGHSAASVQYRQAFNDQSFSAGGMVGDRIANNIAINPNHLAQGGGRYGQKMVLLPHQAPKDDKFIEKIQEQHIQYRNPAHSALLDSLPKATKLVYVTLDGKRRVYHWSDQVAEYKHSANDPDNSPDHYDVKPVIDIHHYERQHLQIKEKRMERAIEHGGYTHDQAEKLAMEEQAYYMDSLKM